MGVKGIGLKTATALISHYQSVTVLYDRLGLSTSSSASSSTIMNTLLENFDYKKYESQQSHDSHLITTTSHNANPYNMTETTTALDIIQEFYDSLRQVKINPKRVYHLLQATPYERIISNMKILQLDKNVNFDKINILNHEICQKKFENLFYSYFQAFREVKNEITDFNSLYFHYEGKRVTVFVIHCCVVYLYHSAYIVRM
jgi:5'-3' exonuclease